MTKPIPQELFEYITVIPETGLIVRRKAMPLAKRNGKSNVGDIMGTRMKTGYVEHFEQEPL